MQSELVPVWVQQQEDDPSVDGVYTSGLAYSVATHAFKVNKRDGFRLRVSWTFRIATYRKKGARTTHQAYRIHLIRIRISLRIHPM